MSKKFLARFARSIRSHSLLALQLLNPAYVMEDTRLDKWTSPT